MSQLLGPEPLLLTVGNNGSGSKKAEERTEFPALGDKDRLLCEETRRKCRKPSEGHGQNAIIYQTIKCREWRGQGEC